MTRRGNGEGSDPITRADGREVSYVRYTAEDGSTGRKSIYGATKKECRANRDKFLDDLENGPPAPAYLQKMTVGEFAQLWATTSLLSRSSSDHTIEAREGIVKNRIVATALGAVRLDRLKGLHIEMWLVELRTKKHYQPATIMAAYHTLCQVLDVAERDNIISRNPARLIDAPKVLRKEAPCLTPEQAHVLIIAAREHTRYAPIFELLCLTGLRRGELLGLQWPDVDLDNGRLSIHQSLGRFKSASDSASKTELRLGVVKTHRSSRPVGISPRAADVFRELRHRQRYERLAAGTKWHDTGFVITGQLGKAIDPDSALDALHRVAKIIGLPKTITLHSLRHTAISAALNSKVPLSVVSDLAGHSTVRTTSDLYGHVSREVNAEAMAVIANAFDFG